MYYKVYVIVLLLSSFCYSQKTIDQTRITGNVKSLVWKEQIIGATVVLDSSDDKILTDFDGNFTITNIKPGTHKLTISYLLHETQIIDSIEINNGETKTLNIEMQEWGKSAAEKDIKNGNIQILIGGMVAFCADFDKVNEICKEFGFEYVLMGCGFLETETYNKIVYKYLDEVNGECWREKFDKRMKEFCEEFQEEN